MLDFRRHRGREGERPDRVDDLRGLPPFLPGAALPLLPSALPKPQGLVGVNVPSRA